MKNNIEKNIEQLISLKLDRESFLIGDKNHDEIYLKDIQAIDNILAEYRRLKQENEELTTNNFKQKNELEIKRREYQETYKDVRDELKELRTENEKKNKIINEMIVEIYKQTHKEDNKCEFLEDIKQCSKHTSCAYCIYDYFERKVENEIK